MNAVAVVCALVMVVPVGIRLGWAYAIFIVSNLLPPLLVGGLTSTGRFTSHDVPAVSVAGRVDAVVPRR